MSKVDTMVLEEPQRACAPFVHSTGLSQHERDIHVRLLGILAQPDTPQWYNCR